MNTSGLLSYQIPAAEALLAAQEKYGGALDRSDMGVGKCLGGSVPVMLYSGESVLARDIRPGMVLMGDDGGPRNVQSVSRGFGPMFRITPIKGDPWECNDEHIIVARGSGNPVKGWTSGDDLEVPLKDYLKLPKSERQHRWKLFKSRGWDRPEVDFLVDPYVYGLWLGDGDVTAGRVTTDVDDVEIHREILSFFGGCGHSVSVYRDKRARAITHSPVYGFWRGWIRLSVREGGEKVILPEYLRSSRAQRESLLAGLLDADGYLSGNNTFEIVTKWTALSSQIEFLAVSLGLRVTRCIKKVLGVGYQRLFISGDTNRLPTRLPRKQAKARSPFKDPLVSGFSVTPVGGGEFFGVVIDGNRRFLLADGTVTHNTAHALAVIRERKVPALVICPQISITAWRRLGDLLGVKFSILNYEAVRTGKTPFGWWDNPRPKVTPTRLRCQSCQLEVDPVNPKPCVHHYLGIHCVKNLPYEHNYGRFNWHENIGQLVFDEVHRASAFPASLQSHLLIAGKRQKIPTLGLSATAGQTPLDLYALGYVLGLHNLLDFYSWASRRGCSKAPWGGLAFMVGEEKKSKIMADLHADVLDRGARVRIEDLGDAFPEVQITAELYDLKEANKIAECYERMDDALKALAEKRGEFESDATKALRAWQEIELLMVPIYEDLVPDALAQGKSVAIFVNFRQTVDELRRRLKCDCFVDGSQTGAAGARQRQACIDGFQEDRERVIICSPAGNASISLHDVRGQYQRVGYVSLGYDAEKVRQIFGRLRRQGGKSKALYRLILAAGTPQEKIHKNVTGKLNRMDLLNDGDLAAGNNLPLLMRGLKDLFHAHE